MKAGDTLVITKPDRVARSVKELLVFLEDELAPRGINLHMAAARAQGRTEGRPVKVSDDLLAAARARRAGGGRSRKSPASSAWGARCCIGHLKTTARLSPRSGHEPGRPGSWPSVQIDVMGRKVGALPQDPWGV
ncbi:hypothetical protein AB0C27_53985 [Nonomuraea sp. NPDC048882]|uniref:hypothetical protein n=1 Tax=Nonomuraea sp. NPDC048882 TaxID=3154347 RepID=UPI0033DD8DB7